jgi:hypothetical protein
MSELMCEEGGVWRGLLLDYTFPSLRRNLFSVQTTLPVWRIHDLHSLLVLPKLPSDAINVS